MTLARLVLTPTLALPILCGQQGPQIAGCPAFPADNIWNIPVDDLPVHPRSADYVASIGETKNLHPDFGRGLWRGGPMGIPFGIVPGTQPKVPVVFRSPGESDPGGYPIPPNPPIEGGADSKGDRHILLVDKDECKLYELFAAYPEADGRWRAGSGAIFDLRSNKLRPEGWTSCDAAGLPILTGLVRYDEVAAGEIRHAIRFTVTRTRRAFVWPGRHYASSQTAPELPPMGQRFRLKASFDISGFPPQARIILRALQKYGMMVSDNGGDWYITGAGDDGWDNDQLNTLKRVKGASFEAVDVSELRVHPDSGQARVKPRLKTPLGGPVRQVSPGEVVTLVGTALGPDAGFEARPVEGSYGTELGGVRLMFGETPAPLTYVSGWEIRAVAPYALERDIATQVRLLYQGREIWSETFPVVEASPAFFVADTGAGQAMALNEDGSPNSGSNPAAPGTVVVLFASGAGQMEPPGVDGLVATEPYRVPRLSVALSIGGLAAAVESAAAAPEQVAGVLKLNARIPEATPAGAQPVSLTVGSAESPAGVTVAIR